MTRCPRCNTWLEIEPGCHGSCLSCHKSSRQDETACVETSCGPEEKSTSKKSNKSASNVVKTKQRAIMKPWKLLAETWKELRNGLFL